MQNMDPMQIALRLARQAQEQNEVPVAAVLIKDGEVISAHHNRVEAICDPTAHAEMLVLKEACAQLQSRYLKGCTLYVTLEPCAMCAHALSLARIDKIIFGAYDPKGGGVEHGARVFDHKTCYHKPEVIGGVDAVACERLLHEFFSSLRA